ncbi:hypothetical protein C7B82_15015 [Stenomitos frigidus ULC18]|uniref:AMIN domain-containing protein n=2 Tax=Stenomitos TaxID=1844270 RepID=A0A2T1E5Z0_9CYAN|nr:hypothetical protein C7B82_15015 [Stenomitos frigidus ULC18]
MTKVLKPATVFFSSLLALFAIAAPFADQTNAQVRPSTPVVNPPLPSQQQPPIATLTPSQGTVGVKLMNKTGADIVYQVIGDTRVRTLRGRSEITLQALKTPVSLSFYRRDRGFLLVSPKVPTTAANTIELTLTETTDFATDKTALTIESDGEVYLN